MTKIEMTKIEKINDMLAWSLYGCTISPRNEESLRAQLAAMSEAEIEERYAVQLRRRARIAGESK